MEGSSCDGLVHGVAMWGGRDAPERAEQVKLAVSDDGQREHVMPLTGRGGLA
jgi:hypothetical protein